MKCLYSDLSKSREVKSTVDELVDRWLASCQRLLPLGESVDTLPDSLGVDVVLADQAFSRLDHSFDPVQVQLHGGSEILMFLDGAFDRFHRGGELHVGQSRFLEEEKDNREVT